MSAAERPADCRCAGSTSGPGMVCQACRRRWAERARALEAALKDIPGVIQARVTVTERAR